MDNSEVKSNKITIVTEFKVIDSGSSDQQLAEQKASKFNKAQVLASVAALAPIDEISNSYILGYN